MQRRPAGPAFAYDPAARAPAHRMRGGPAQPDGNAADMFRAKLLAVSDAAAAAAPPRLQLLPVLLAVLAVKIAVLLVDINPRFFLWDSVTYLQGAVGGPLPRDRSFLYSFLIEAIAVPTHSLHALVLAQTLAGVASALLVHVILRRFLAVPFGVALAATLLFALGPSQLFYERMVMAEAFGGMLWLAFIALALAYMRDGRAAWLAAIALVGIGAVAFRLNGTMVIVVVSATLPLLRWWLTPRAARANAEDAFDRRRLALQVALALACTFIVHSGYRQIVGRVAHTEPGYIGTEGLFLLGFVAPAVEEKDFRGTGCSADVLTRLRRPLADPRNREYQLWGEGGLWAVMQKQCPAPEAAAGTVAHRAFARIPRWILPMAFATAAQYFDDNESTWRMNSDLGRKGMLPLELIEPARKYFFLDVASIAFTDTLTSVMFEHSRWWLAGCFLLAPLLAAGLVWRTRRDANAAEPRLLALVMSGLFLSQFLLSPVIAFRYLHPFPPLAILCVAALLARMRPRGAGIAAAAYAPAPSSPGEIGAAPAATPASPALHS